MTRNALAIYDEFRPIKSDFMAIKSEAHPTDQLF